VTGEEHAAEAERLLALCAGDQRGSALDLACTAAAQVHATLAQAAYFAETLKVTRDAQDRAERVIASYRTP